MNGTNPNPWAALGLPASWAPTPTGCQVGQIDGLVEGRPVRMFVLAFDTAVGRLGIGLTYDQARALRDALSAQVSGLTVPPAVPFQQSGRPA